MTRFVDLTITEGPEIGMRFSVERGGYRVIGRKGGFISETVRMNGEGDRLLDPEQNAVVDEFLAARPAQTRTRKRGADILLDDHSISRTHALVFLGTEGASVVDLMSTNGTKKNGNKVNEAALTFGDEIKIGNSVFLLSEG